MKNKFVGYILIGIGLFIGALIVLFLRTLDKIVVTSCIIGGVCAHETTMNFLTGISILLILILVFVGIYLIFFSHEERIITKIKKIKEQIQPKKITKENYKEVIDALEDDEKKIFENIIDSKGSIMQSELVAHSGLTKVKVTRILDRLQGKGLIGRERRGMTNIVILK